MDKNSKKSFYEHWYERGLSDVPFQLSFDPSILKAQDNIKEFKKSKEILSEYNLDLENKIIAELDKKPLYPKLPDIKSILKPDNVKYATNTGASIINPSIPDNEEPIKNIERTIRNIDSERPNTSIINKTNPSHSFTMSTMTKALGNSSLASMEKCNLYLPNETEEKKIAYCTLWDATRPMSPDDMDVLRAFFQFDGNVERATLFLKSFLALKELGFPEDKITTALMMHNNDQDMALDYLMSRL